MVTGQGASLQLGQETSWGVKVAPTTAINFTSESFKPQIDRTEEDSLIGNATASSMDIQKRSTVIGWEQLAKPENIGLVLAMALGVEAAPVEDTEKDDVFSHKFTLLKPGLTSSLPKFTAYVDRHVAVKAYTGCKIGSLGISCSAGDYMRISVSGIGKDEVSGAIDSSLIVPALKAFRFAGGKVKFDDVENGEITSIECNIENSLDDGEQTTGSGYYGTESEPQKRAVTLSCNAFYSSESETVRNTYYKTESEAAIELSFISPSEIVSGVNYEIKIEMPHVVITEADPNVSGTDKIRLTIGGTAVQSGTDEPITITLIDSKSTKYSA